MKRRVLPPINFKAYRRPVYMHAVHDEFGLGVVMHRQSYKRGPCPICHGGGERPRCFAWDFDKCSFYCHACKKGGDALELVKLLKGCSVIEAAKWLEEQGGPAGSGLVLFPPALLGGTETAS